LNILKVNIYSSFLALISREKYDLVCLDTKYYL